MESAGIVESTRLHKNNARILKKRKISVRDKTQAAQVAPSRERREGKNRKLPSQKRDEGITMTEIEHLGKVARQFSRSQNTSTNIVFLTNCSSFKFIHNPLQVEGIFYDRPNSIANRERGETLKGTPSLFWPAVYGLVT